MTIDTTKLKPFDLERALAGDPVVTRNGMPVLVYYLKAAAELYQVVAVRISDGTIMCYRPVTGICSHSPYDLFMAPKKKTVYVNFYEDDPNSGEAVWYENKDVAVESAASRAIAVAVPVEIEV